MLSLLVSFRHGARRQHHGPTPRRQTLHHDRGVSGTRLRATGQLHRPSTSHYTDRWFIDLRFRPRPTPIATPLLFSHPPTSKRRFLTYYRREARVSWVTPPLGEGHRCSEAGFNSRGVCRVGAPSGLPQSAIAHSPGTTRDSLLLQHEFSASWRRTEARGVQLLAVWGGRDSSPSSLPAPSWPSGLRNTSFCVNGKCARAERRLRRLVRV